MFAVFSSWRIGVAFMKQWINKSVIQNCSRVVNIKGNESIWWILNTKIYPDLLFEDTFAVINSNKISIRGSNTLDIGRREEIVRNYLLGYKKNIKRT